MSCLRTVNVGQMNVKLKKCQRKWIVLSMYCVLLGSQVAVDRGCERYVVHSMNEVYGSTEMSAE